MANAPTSRPAVMGFSHMVVAGHPLAAVAANRVLEAGGNAIDAGVAGGFALNVVHPDFANLGGIAPIMLYSAAARKVTSFSGVGRWPQGASLERLIAVAKGGRLPAGPQCWIVPAAVDAWLTALSCYGTLSVSEVLAPAIELADKGFPAHYVLRANIDKPFFAKPAATENRAVYYPSGMLPNPGELIRQPGLATTLRLLVDAESRAAGSRVNRIQAARDCFYKGEIAAHIADYSRGMGGFLTIDDLAEFAVGEETPLSITYRGRKVYSCGPWCQGPALLEMLNLAEQVPLADLDPAIAQSILVECVNLALADRNAYYGDPEFVDVPMERLLSKQYAQEWRHRIDAGTTFSEGPRLAHAGALMPDTTYICVVDAAGNAFSATPSDGPITSAPMVPGLGFGISQRGFQSSLDPDNPNVMAPRKRPRVTPNPGLVIGDDFTLTYGTPGGDVQSQAMLQFLINHLDLGMDVQAAVEAPRWASYAVPATEYPHPSIARRVHVEADMPPPVSDELSRREFDVAPWPRLAALAGGVCAIRREHGSGLLTGAADPRRMAYAVGW